MAALTKTVQTALLAIQSNAASTVLISTPFALATHLSALVQLRFGRRSATSGTAACNIRVESSASASDAGPWFPIAIIATNFAACEAEAVTGTVALGQKVITCASTTNLSIGDLIFIDNGTIGNSEWARIKSIVANTSVTI